MQFPRQIIVLILGLEICRIHVMVAMAIYACGEARAAVVQDVVYPGVAHRFELAVFGCCVRSRGAEDGIETFARVPPIQIAFAKRRASLMEFPELVDAELFRVLVRLHLRPKRLVDGLQDIADGLAAVRDEKLSEQFHCFSVVYRGPVNEHVRSLGLEFRDDLFEGALDRWRRRHEAVVPKHGDLELGLEGDRAPGQVDTLGISEPRGFAHYRTSPELEVGDAACHRAVNGAHRFLASKTGAGVEMREAAV